MRIPLLITIVAMSTLAACQVSMANESPYRRAAVPADGKIVLTDPGLRDWGPELVCYTLDTKAFPPGKLALLGPDGRAVPFQVEHGTLSFVASVPQRKSVTYTLVKSAADRSAENTTLRVFATDKGIEISNEFLALLLPPAGSQSFPSPAAADKVTPPLLGWKTAGSDWVGESRFATPRKFASQALQIFRQGPACVEFEARYTFAPKGEYMMRVRLSPGIPLAAVVEEFDMGETGRGEHMLVLALHKGWQPKMLARLAGGLQASPIEDYVRERQGAQDKAPVGGVGQSPLPMPPEAGLTALPGIVPGGKWGGLLGGLQVFDGDTPEAGRNLAIVTLHVGSWRRTMAMSPYYKPGEGMLVSLPIGVRPMRWSSEIADDFSPFSSHEHDSELPVTYGRREWCFYAGANANTVQGRFGYIGLDRYKDWVVDLPDPKPGTASPRPLFSPAAVNATKAVLDQHPDAALLKTWYLFSGNPADAVRQAETVLTGLKETMVIGDGGDHNFMANGITGYRQAQQLAFAMRAEDALACPELPVETRRELRRWLAIYANLGSEPDFNPRGSGVHLGNNNMSYNRTLMLTYFAALLPDHPCQAYWLERIRAFCEYKFATEFGWDGASLECPAYQLYAPARALIVAQTALRNLGVANLSKGGALRANLQFLANLTMPDARIGNKRILPGMGNSPNCLESIWGIAMAAEEGDAVFAGWLKSMHRLAKGSITENQGQAGGGDWNCYPLFYRPAVPDQPVQFASTFMPTYGLVFRAHFGTPLETAMLLRAGGNWGHWDTDALNVILYGQRAPLSPGTGYQYLANPAPQLDNGIYHNRVKVGQRDLQEVFGRVDAGIADYGFAEWADYAVADRYYPPELFADGKGEMHWRRHVLFLKSAKPEGANYFVMRDTFPGGEARPKWWNWLNLDGSDLISVDGQAFARAEMNKVVGEGDMPKKTGQVVELKTTYGASTWFWFSRPVEVRIRMTFDAAAQGSVPAGMEVKTIVEIPAGAGEDFFYVVWPRPDGASVPKCQLLAPGVIQIETAEATDYAFLADKPLTFHRDGITFQGAAGAVRQAAGGAPAGLLTVSPGPRLVTDLGRGVTVSGEGPFEARLEGDVIKLKVSGRTRMLHMTQPSFIVRPDYRVDGRQSMACWTDYPASDWGSYKNSWLIALPVPAGDHELTVSNLRFPPGWARQFTPRIGAGLER